MSVQDFCLLCPGRDGPPEPRPGYWWASTYLKLWVVSVLCQPLPFSEIIFSWWRILPEHTQEAMKNSGWQSWVHTSDLTHLSSGSCIKKDTEFLGPDSRCFAYFPAPQALAFHSAHPLRAEFLGAKNMSIAFDWQVKSGWKMASEKPTTLKHKPQQIPSRPRAQHHWSLYLAGSSHNCRQETWSLSSTPGKESQDQHLIKTAHKMVIDNF